jgi:hypothetical protein
MYRNTHNTQGAIMTKRHVILVGLIAVSGACYAQFSVEVPKHWEGIVRLDDCNFHAGVTATCVATNLTDRAVNLYPAAYVTYDKGGVRIGTGKITNDPIPPKAKERVMFAGGGPEVRKVVITGP